MLSEDQEKISLNRQFGSFKKILFLGLFGSSSSRRIQSLVCCMNEAADPGGSPFMAGRAG